jgi:hypothetical protein
MSSPDTSSSLTLSLAGLQHHQQPLIFTMPSGATLLQDGTDLNSLASASEMTPIVLPRYNRRRDLELDDDDLANHTQTPPGGDHSPLTSPGLLSPGMATPVGNGGDCQHFMDGNTQQSLVEVSQKLNIIDEASMGGGGTVDVDSSSLWGMVDADHAEGAQDEAFRKVRKSVRKSDAASSVHCESADEDVGVFDAKGAISTSQFGFTKFGSDLRTSGDVPIFSGDSYYVVPGVSGAMTSSSNGIPSNV